MDYSSFLMTSFKKVVQALDADQVDFAVCGMAYSILVSPRATIDFDCLIMAYPNSLMEINRILQPPPGSGGYFQYSQFFRRQT